MKKVTIKIGKKTYVLVFNYGVNRRLAKAYKLASYTALGKLIEDLKFGENDELTFDQLDFVAALTRASIESSDNPELELNNDAIVEFYLNNPDDLKAVLEAYAQSFPKGGPNEGKQQPTQKSK